MLIKRESFTSFNKLLFVSVPFFYYLPLTANVVWPQLFAVVPVAVALYEALILIPISIVIEAVCFYVFTKNISWRKAFFFSLIGNAASTFVGTIFAAISTVTFWHILDDIFTIQAFRGMANFGIYGGFYEILSWILMYLLSALIEMFVLSLLRISSKEIALSVFVGNFITYLLAFLYFYVYLHPEHIKYTLESISYYF